MCERLARTTLTSGLLSVLVFLTPTVPDCRSERSGLAGRCGLCRGLAGAHHAYVFVAGVEGAGHHGVAKCLLKNLANATILQVQTAPVRVVTCKLIV